MLLLGSVAIVTIAGTMGVVRDATELRGITVPSCCSSSVLTGGLVRQIHNLRLMTNAVDGAEADTS